MSKKMDTVKTGWIIPEDVKDRFTEFCHEHDEIIQGAVAAALTVYRYLPASIRDLAKLEAKGSVEPQVEFWTEFGRGLQVAIHAELLSQQESPATEQKAPKKG